MKSICLIGIFIDVGILPEVSSFSHCFSNIDFYWLVTIDIQLNSCWSNIVKIFKNLSQSFVKIIFWVLILHIRNWHMKLVFRSKVNFIITIRKLIRNLHSSNYRSFISPTTRNVSKSIASTTSKKNRNTKAFHELCYWCMTFYWKIEASKSVSWKTVSSSLKKNSFRSEIFHNFSKNRPCYSHKRFIIHTFIQWEIDRMISTIFFSNVINVSCTWEIVFKFMERACHYSISKIKGLFNTITMMNININVQDSLISFEKF